jgi:hypothetical protein
VTQGVKTSLINVSTNIKMIESRMKWEGHTEVWGDEKGIQRPILGLRDSERVNPNTNRTALLTWSVAIWSCPLCKAQSGVVTCSAGIRRLEAAHETRSHISLSGAFRYEQETFI